MDVLLVDLALALVVLGLVSLIRPLRILRIRTRRTALLILVVGFALLIVALSLPVVPPRLPFFAARQLALLGFEPVVTDAREVRLKAQRPNQKSDRRDAFEICDGLRRDIFRTIVYVPPLSLCTLRETLSRRRHFVRLKTAEVNATKRLLRASGRGGDARSLGTRVAWDLLLVRIRDDASLLACVELHRETWRHGDAQVQFLDNRLEEQSQEFTKPIELLRTIPGVGRMPSVATTSRRRSGTGLARSKRFNN